MHGCDRVCDMRTFPCTYLLCNTCMQAKNSLLLRRCGGREQLCLALQTHIVIGHNACNLGNALALLRSECPLGGHLQPMHQQ